MTDTLALESAGSIVDRIWGWLKSFFTERKAPVHISVDRKAVYQVVDQADPGPRTPPTEPGIREVEGRLEPVAGKPGTGIDAAQVIEKVPDVLSQDEAWEFMTWVGAILVTAGFDVRVPPLSRKKPSPQLRLTSTEAQTWAQRYFGEGSAWTRYRLSPLTAGDGYTLWVGTQSMTEINPSVFPKLRWKPDDFAPLVKGVEAPLILVTHDLELAAKTQRIIRIKGGRL